MTDPLRSQLAQVIAQIRELPRYVESDVVRRSSMQEYVDADQLDTVLETLLSVASSTGTGPASAERHCEWPGCAQPAFCRSGNFGSRLVCRDHFKITNGLSTAAETNSTSAKKRIRVHASATCLDCGFPLVWTEAWQGWDCVVCIRRDRDQIVESAPPPVAEDAGLLNIAMKIAERELADRPGMREVRIITARFRGETPGDPQEPQ
jgi:hypothetical protein